VLVGLISHELFKLIKGLFSISRFILLAYKGYRWPNLDMATDFNVIKSYLKDEGYSFIHSSGSEYIETSIKTENYRNDDSAKSLSLFIKLEEDGKFIKVLAPYVYRCALKSGSNRKAALFQALLQICWKTKMVQFEYDSDDGEIRAIVEFALEDTALSKLQLIRIMSTLSSVVDLYHEEIVKALTVDGDYGLAASNYEKEARFSTVLNRTESNKVRVK